MRAVPVRGTQSFVGVMAEVFKRPSLTGLEILWRWVFWVAVLARPGRSLFAGIMQAVNAFQEGGFPSFAEAASASLQEVKRLAATHAAWILLGVALWIVIGTIGRKLLLHRVDRSLRFPMGAIVVLSALRWFVWAFTVGVWSAAFLVSLSHFVTQPQAHGTEPEWIPFCALLITGTLVLFVLWLGLSWAFSVMPIYAAQGASLKECIRRAFRRGPVRGKLAEINLVMGIVKIALIVLAMVFSACPLPFETVETQSFLVAWTVAVLLLYVLASDYFHVVRLVAFLRMTEVFPGLPKDSAARSGEGAS